MKSRTRLAAISAGAVLLFASLSATAQRAYVDPVTGQLTTRPPGDAKAAPDAPIRPVMKAQRNAQGYEYIDTSEYRMVTRARIGKTGDVELTCEHGVADHDHADVTASKDESP